MCITCEERENQKYNEELRKRKAAQMEMTPRETAEKIVKKDFLKNTRSEHWIDQIEQALLAEREKATKEAVSKFAPVVEALKDILEHQKKYEIQIPSGLVVRFMRAKEVLAHYEKEVIGK